MTQSCDNISFYGADQKGNSLFVKMNHRGYHTTELILQITLSDGRVYVLPGKSHFFLTFTQRTHACIHTQKNNYNTLTIFSF